MSSATIRYTPRGSSESVTLSLKYHMFSSNEWTSPSKPGGEWVSSSVAGLQFFNSSEASDKPVWLKLYDIQWDISHDINKGDSGWGVQVATSKVVDWEVVSVSPL